MTAYTSVMIAAAFVVIGAVPGVSAAPQLPGRFADVGLSADVRPVAQPSTPWTEPAEPGTPPAEETFEPPAPEPETETDELRRPAPEAVPPQRPDEPAQPEISETRDNG
jgi:hypothetical protein